MTTIMRGIGSSPSAKPEPSHGSTSCSDSALVKARTSTTPVLERASSTAERTSASMSRPETGRTWIVTSRPTSDCQSDAAPTTIITAPVVSAARKVMIATTAASERPAIAPLGTIGVGARCTGIRTAAAWRLSHGSANVSAGSIIDIQS